MSPSSRYVVRAASCQSIGQEAPSPLMETQQSAQEVPPRFPKIQDDQGVQRMCHNVVENL